MTSPWISGSRRRLAFSFTARAVTGFVLVTGVTACVVLGSVLLAEKATRRAEQAVARLAVDTRSVFRAELAVQQMIAAARGYILTEDSDLLQEVNRAKVKIDDAVVELRRLEASSEKRALLDAVGRAAAKYRGAVEGFFSPRTRAGNGAALSDEFQTSLLPAGAELVDRLEELVERERELETAGLASVRQDAERFLHLIIAIGSAGVALSAFLAWSFTRHLAGLHAKQEDATQRARNATARREEQLAVVAHDLRNPLSAIAGRAAMLMRHGPDDQTRQLAQSIESVARRVHSLVQDLVDAATIEASRFSVKPGACSVPELLESTVDMFEALANQKAIQLSQSVEPTNFTVFADRERILQALSNLVGNAIKFTPQHGEVSIRAIAAGPSVRFEVRDSGPGIEPRQLPHLFDRYWKGESSDQRGTGLGLYIAKGIVDAHGGRLWVESQPGRGARFYFELSSRLVAAPDQPSDAPQWSATTG